MRFLPVSALIVLAGAGCDCGPTPDRPDARFEVDSPPAIDAGFICSMDGEEVCVGEVHTTCILDGEFLRAETEDCREREMICLPDLWCAVCRPGAVSCIENDAVRCRDDASGWDVIEECDGEAGYVCQDGMCIQLCQQALEQQSYVGCEFYAADLDNAALGPGSDASGQQYAVVVSNPSGVETLVVIERNDAPLGMEPLIVEETSVRILPGDLEIFPLPRREVDGSSIRGMNDGTHSAVTSNAYRIRSTLPIIAYQFNPLSNAGVFSNDASLLLPTSAVGNDYTIVGWPQTIANEPSRNPDYDFDPTVEDEDLRAFLTIVGTQPNTRVTLRVRDLGPRLASIVGGGLIPPLDNGDVFEITIGPFDVINFETQGLNSDFTGSSISATAPVTVFVGSEASDAPRFETYATRQCCADHLEEQLFPDRVAGQRYFIARQYPRTKALNAAFLDPRADSVGEVNEPEWVRVVAVSDSATLRTSLPPPDDFPPTLARGDSVILRADRNFTLEVLEDDGRIHVLQATPSQGAVGIDSRYPGGDPFILAVPPVEQYRDNYVFLTPPLYAFDMVSIVAPRLDSDGRLLPIVFDGELVEERITPLGDPACIPSPADGIPRRDGDPPPEYLVWQCQLSFPDVIGLPNVRVEEGEQHDGVHTIYSTRPIGVLVSGFDSYVSYGYVAGLNLEPLPF